MENNLQSIAKTVDYIEARLEESLDLERVANEAGYSKYHLHRMFTNITGFTVHGYIKRRRLTEAARALIFTEQSVMDIALFAGYETQRSFTSAFKAMFNCAPQAFRRKRDFYPLQLKFTVDGKKQLRGDAVMDIKTVESGKILLAGYKVNTKWGFAVIGKCMRRFLANKDKIGNQAEKDRIIALNDYANFASESKQPCFDFYAAVEVEDFSLIPKGMITKELLPSKYVVFSFVGKPEDSIQPVADYIYKEWFPQSTCKFNESNMYDFTKSYKIADNDDNSNIEYWVPIE